MIVWATLKSREDSGIDFIFKIIQNLENTVIKIIMVIPPLTWGASITVIAKKEQLPKSVLLNFTDLFSFFVYLFYPLPEKDHGSAWSTEWLVSGSCHYICILKRRWNNTSSNKPTDVGHISQKDSFLLMAYLLTPIKTMELQQPALGERLHILKSYWLVSEWERERE